MAHVAIIYSLHEPNAINARQIKVAVPNSLPVTQGYIVQPPASVQPVSVASAPNPVPAVSTPPKSAPSKTPPEIKKPAQPAPTKTTLKPEPVIKKQKPEKVQQKKQVKPVEPATLADKRETSEKNDDLKNSNARQSNENRNESDAPDATTQQAAKVTAPIIDASAQKNNPPIYPRLSKRLKEQGRVVLELVVQPDGTTTNVKIHASSGYSRLDQAALEAVKKWRYTPAQQGEINIAYNYLQPVEFSLQ